MSATPNVLAVVPEPSEFALIAAGLATSGVRTCHAADLLEAILHQYGCPADVILCDADRIDWGQAIELFRQFRHPSRVIFLTRLADERLWLEMLDAGADDLLEKPCRPEDLRWVVDAASHRPYARAVSA